MGRNHGSLSGGGGFVSRAASLEGHPPALQPSGLHEGRNGPSLGKAEHRPLRRAEEHRQGGGSQPLRHGQDGMPGSDGVLTAAPKARQGSGPTGRHGQQCQGTRVGRQILPSASLAEHCAKVRCPAQMMLRH